MAHPENSQFTIEEKLAIAIIRDDLELAYMCMYNGLRLPNQKRRMATLEEAIIHLLGSPSHEVNSMIVGYLHWYRSVFVSRLALPPSRSADLHAIELTLELRNIRCGLEAHSGI